jgi:D-alanine-D-alanine ligase-like ATP-grasp enzyme
MNHTATTITKKTCPHCGNNPMPHFQSWLDTTICIILNPLTEKVLRTRIGRLIFSFTNFLIKGTLALALVLRIARFDDDQALVVSDRGRVLLDEAYARGWKMETLRVFGKVTDVFKLTTPTGASLVFNGLPRINGIHDDILTGWIDDKALLKERLTKEGVPVSRGRSFVHWKDAEAYFATAEKPLIVKPRLGSRGRHTTTHISNLTDFKRAFEIGKQMGRHVIVEEHLIGSVYRGTIVDGVLMGVLAGDPPRITGDGVHTIRELIDIKNANRHERVKGIAVTDRMETFLKRLGYTPDTILKSGVTIDLSEKIGLSYGGNAREVTPLVHPKLHQELERAAKIVGDPFLGFDFISTDISADPDTVKWGIIECNTVPFINLHHDPLEGEPINVARAVLDYVERKIT